MTRYQSDQQDLLSDEKIGFNAYVRVRDGAPLPDVKAEIKKLGLTAKSMDDQLADVTRSFLVVKLALSLFGLIAVLVAANILFVGWRLVRSSFGGLMDEGLEPEDLARLRPALEGAMTGAIEIHGLRSRRAGPTTFLEFHLVVPKEMTIARAHEICDRLEEEIERILPGAEPAIHVEPEGEAAHGSFVLRAHR